MVNLVDIESKDESESTPNPLMAMIFFFIVTSIYCVISILIADEHQRIIAKVCYMIFVVIGEYFINLTLSRQMCGIVQWKTTMFITLIPWVMIFGVLHLFLIMFPGWSTPFANTFGYLVAKLMGLPDLMKKILVEKIDVAGTSDTSNAEAARALESVRTDNSLFINELYAESGKQIMQKTDPITKKGLFEDNGEPVRAKTDEPSITYKVDGKMIKERPIFDKAWNKLLSSGIIKKPEGDYTKVMSEKGKESLYHFVQMKYTISEYVWNLLTGFLVTSISYNYIINTGCAKSPTEMKDRYDKYEAEEDKRKKDKEAEEAKKPNYTAT